MASNDPPPPSSADARKGSLSTPGAPSGGGGRLPSIRGPRDLTLGGVKKKNFAPSIPVRRKVDDNGASVDSAPNNENRGKNNDKRGQRSERGGGDRGRGRGRGRGRPEVIQSHSIFEQGMAEGNKKVRGGYESVSYGGGGGRSGGGGGGGVSGLKRERRTDQETKEMLDNLLRDDFIEGGELRGDDPNLVPTQLPLVKPKKREVKGELDTKPALKIKTEPSVKVETALDPDLLETFGDADTADAAISQYLQSLSTKPTTCADLFTRPSKSEHGELLFMQLPDTLPGDPPTREEGRSSGQQGQQGQVDATQVKEEHKPKDPQELLAQRLGLCSLEDFDEGYIGKLQIHASGKTTLLLGNVTLDVAMGAPAGFLQDLVSVQLQGDSGDMTVLGHVDHKLVCTPDFDSLLNLPR